MMAVRPQQPGGAVRKPDKVQPLPAHMIERLPSFMLDKTALVRRCCLIQPDSRCFCMVPCIMQTTASDYRTFAR